MTTPDPIALPELPTCHTFQHPERLYTANQMRAYGQACVDALTPAPQVPEGMVLVPRGELNRVIHELRTYDPAGDTYKGARIHGVWAKELEQLSATPPLNEPFGNAEQLASLEQRARELLAAEYEKAGFMGAADDARADVPSPHCQVTLRAIIAALSAQPREREAERISAAFYEAGDYFDRASPWQKVYGWILDKAIDKQESPAGIQPVAWQCWTYHGGWEDCTKELHDHIVATGHYGEPAISPKAQARSLYTAPQSREVRGVDVESMLKACVPGGDIVDPQLVADNIRSWFATTPQDAAGVEGVGLLNETERSALSALLANLYHEAEDVEDSAPSVEDNEDAYWAYQQWHAITKLLGMEKIHTTPPPGVDVGKLRELAVKWRALAAGERETAKHFSVPARDAQAMNGLARILDGMADELTTIIDAAAPGVQ